MTTSGNKKDDPRILGVDAGFHGTKVASDSKHNAILNNKVFPDKMTIEEVEDILTFFEKSQELRDREPLKFAKWLATSTKSSFFIMMSLQFIPLVVTIALLLVGYDIFPISFTSLPLILSDVTRERDLAWRYRDDFSNRLIVSVGSDTPTWSRGQRIDGLELIYEKKNADIFRVGYLEAIKSVEDELFNATGYQSMYCQKDKQNQCVKPDSILRFFDGTYSHVSPTFYDPYFNNVASVLWLANYLNETKETLQYHLGEDSVINNNSSATGSITRSLVPIGWPLSSVPGTTDEKRTRITEFMVNNFMPIVTKYKASGVNGMVLTYYSGLLFSNDVNTQAIYDMLLAVGSFAFIFIVVYIQTASLWITAWSVLSIITAFLTTNIIYRCVIGYRYFGFFHVLSIFIILGIGADDIFIYTDTWKYTKHATYKSLAHRISDTYRRSSVTMLVTSLTTMAAFIVSAFSPLLAVQSFGVFSGILVVVNYCNVVLFVPTVVTFHEVFFAQYNCLCCACARCNRKPETKVVPIDTAPQSMKQFVDQKFYEYADTKNPDYEDSWRFSQSDRVVVRCFGGIYFRLINSKAGKWTIVVIFIVLMGVGAYFASQIVPDERNIRIYKDDHNYGRAMYHRVYSFKPTASNPNTLTVYFAWGMKPRDLTSCPFYDTGDCKGIQQYDDTFSMDTQANQQSILDLCSKLKNLDSKSATDLNIGRDVVTGELRISCFMTPLAGYMSLYATSLPLVSGNTRTFMNTQTNIYNTSLLPNSYNSYLEIGLTHWLTNGYKFNWTNDYQEYNSLLGQIRDTYTVTVPPAGFYGSKLKYMGILINTTLDRRSVSFTTGLPLMEKYEAFLNSEMKSMDASLQNGFQCTRNSWHWSKVQQSLFYNALIGIGIGLGLSFPVILFATQNICLALMSLVTLCGITVCTVAVLPIAGWKLGVLESLNLCLIVGLSIDYCVHLTEGYYHSLYRLRKDRVRDTLERVGVSILSGAGTTLGASAFMLFAQIQFFVQFGIFMFATIGFSIAFSMLFFVALLSICGPEGDQCSFAPCCRKCCHKDGTQQHTVQGVTSQVTLSPRLKDNF